MTDTTLEDMLNTLPREWAISIHRTETVFPYPTTWQCTIDTDPHLAMITYPRMPLSSAIVNADTVTAAVIGALKLAREHTEEANGEEQPCGRT